MSFARKPSISFKVDVSGLQVDLTQTQIQAQIDDALDMMVWPRAPPQRVVAGHAAGRQAVGC